MRWFWIAVLVAVVGCAPITRVSKFDSEARPVSERVDVFTNPQNIPYQYKEVGLITVDDEGWGRSENELLEKAITQAKNIGADGIIILSQDKQHSGYVPAGNVVMSVNRRVVRASAIVKAE